MLSVSGRRAAVLTGLLRSFLRARGGSTAVEYTIIAAIVSMAIIASLGSMAGSLSDTLEAVATRMQVN